MAKQPKKSKSPKGKPKRAVNVKSAENCAKALEMRLRDMTYAQIGERLGVTTQMAYFYVKTALDELARQTLEKADQLRTFMAARLTRLGLAANVVLQQAQSDGDSRLVLTTIETLARLDERYCRLYGLDAPIKAEITGKDGGPIVGAFIVPGTVPLGEWSAEAVRQQAALAERSEVIDAE